jgi:hypothetical protein
MEPSELRGKEGVVDLEGVGDDVVALSVALGLVGGTRGEEDG